MCQCTHSKGNLKIAKIDYGYFPRTFLFYFSEILLKFLQNLLKVTKKCLRNYFYTKISQDILGNFIKKFIKNVSGFKKRLSKFLKISLKLYFKILLIDVFRSSM